MGLYNVHIHRKFGYNQIGRFLSVIFFLTIKMQTDLQPSVAYT